jgi:UDP-N-acetylmuramoyl-L-alanyl-D-glutamate--2,6-diaminopimelate ligase
MPVTLGDIADLLKARVSGHRLGAAIRASSSAVTHDSRRVVSGGIFVAIEGAHTDGNRFVGDATKRGAIAIISEKPCPDGFSEMWLQVADARAALAQTAALVHGYPSRRLKLAGVTGTNGKTTVAHLVAAILQAAGEVPAMMGTISYRLGAEEVTAEHTTPEASEIQDFLRRAVEAGAHYAVMEVSSHAIDLRRVEGLEFAAAAFTNLTQDHLDYHRTMEEYFTVKRRLFDGGIGARPARSVINLDDPRGAELRALGGAGALTYALEAAADITTGAREFGLEGLSFTARTPRGEIEIASPLVGRAHAYNILCAIGIGLALGFAPEVIARGIAECRCVAGRFERVSAAEDDITVVVDYAHTPDALVNVLRTVRDATGTGGGQVVTVMGCGGDRDRTKRPLMGEAAAQLSDRVIATSDNPRSEDPAAILADIEAGLKKAGAPYELLADRRAAIFRAVAEAAPGAVVLIAGKGHEDYQILASGKIHFDDREVAREALAVRRLKVGD